MINKISAAFYFDTRNMKKDGRHPIKLRVIYQPEKMLYATGYDATPYEWEVINSNEAKGKLRTIRSNFDGILKKADELFLNMANFSFNVFEKSFFDPIHKTKSLDVYVAYDVYMKE